MRPDLSRVRAVLALARLAVEVNRGLAVVVAVLAALESLVPVATALLTGAALGTVASVIRDGLQSEAGTQLVMLLAGVAVVEAVPVSELRWRLGNSLGQRIGVRLDSRVMESLGTPPGIAHLEDSDVRDQASKAITFWNSSVVEGTVNVGVLRLQGLAAAVLVTSRVWLAGLVLTVTWLAYGYWARRRSKTMTDLQFDATPEMRTADYVTELVLAPEAAKETRVFGMREWLLDRHLTRWTRAMEPVLRGRRTGGPAALVVGAGLAGAHVVAFVALAAAARSGAIGFGMVAALAQAVLTMSGLGGFTFGGWETEYGLRTVPANVDLHRMVREPRFRMDGHREAVAMPKREIRFEDVRFRYAGRDEDVLRGVDLVIPAGSSLAVVGANGAGKTTLVKLLCRFYDPSAGRVTVDGVDLRDLDARSWQRGVAAVFQQFLRYPLTAAENVAFGRTDVDETSLELAADRAGALDLVRGLPGGWHTPLTREASGGADLSGGQWQRVALARALYAVLAGAGVLVLDEPTAHLDARAEAHLYDQFLAVVSGATTVLVSHRFSTVRRADSIVVLDDGRVAEQGTHDELVSLGGRYAELFRLQASRFADA